MHTKQIILTTMIMLASHTSWTNNNGNDSKARMHSKEAQVIVDPLQLIEALGPLDPRCITLAQAKVLGPILKNEIILDQLLPVLMGQCAEGIFAALQVCNIGAAPAYHNLFLALTSTNKAQQVCAIRYILKTAKQQCETFASQTVGTEQQQSPQQQA